MKVAFILPRLANQGPIIVAKDIINNLLNHDNVVVDIYYFDSLTEIDIKGNLYKISLFNKIDFNQYDVVHSHMLRPDFYIWLHRNKKHCKPLFISTLHQNIYDNLKGNYNRFIAFFFEKIWLRFLNKQDILVALTNDMKNYYSKKVNVDIETIYNGRSLNTINKDLCKEDFDIISNIKSKYKIIGSHCLLTKRKGIHQIITSLVTLEEYALIIIGNGKELSHLKLLAHQLHVEDRCIFLGYRANAVSYLKYFDIYVMSSYSEGFPLGLLEAGLNKLPVVCSDISIFKELFTEQEVCFFELDNIDSLTKSIEYVNDNKINFSSSLYKKIINEYSINKMVESYYTLYKSKHLRNN